MTVELKDCRVFDYFCIHSTITPPACMPKGAGVLKRLKTSYELPVHCLL